MRQKVFFGWSSKRISSALGYHEKTIQKWIRLFKITGSPERNGNRTRSQLIPEEVMKELKDLLTQNPSLYLWEIQEDLMEKQIPVSISTIHRCLKRLNFTRKILKRFSSRKNELAILRFRCMVENIPASTFLWLDETGKKESDCQRRYGYSLRGYEARSPSFKHGDKRVNAIAFISTDGLGDYSLTSKTIKSEDVREFVKDYVLPVTSPFPGPKSVLVLDKYI